MAAEEGLPSRTDFWVVGTSAVDITELVGPGELVADISTFDTRHGDQYICCLQSLWQAFQTNYMDTLRCSISTDCPGAPLCCAARRAQAGRTRSGCMWRMLRTLSSGTRSTA